MAYRRSWYKVAALALASALACSGAAACGRSVAGLCAAPSNPPGYPHIQIPEHPAPIPVASPRDWARWWRSGHRPPSVHRTLVLNGRPVELTLEALLPGWQYPCTDTELETALRGLPAAWTARLSSVRLTFHPEWDAQARTDRARIEISYIVDQTLRAPGEVAGDTPEELQFGARLETENGTQSLVWPDQDALRVYILRHILVHELGHHVAPPGLAPDAEEDWAEAFAYRYYTPHAARRVAASHR